MSETPQIERGVEILSIDAGLATRCLRRGEPFELNLAWKPLAISQMHQEGLGYSASISAFKRGDRASYFLTCQEGTLAVGDNFIRLRIPRQNFDPGAYSVRAEVLMTALPASEDEAPPRPLGTLHLRSRLLQVV